MFVWKQISLNQKVGYVSYGHSPQWYMSAKKVFLAF